MKIVLLDRDGVICKDYIDYVYTLDKFEFLPGSLKGIKLLTQNGYHIFVVTNQSGIGLSIFTCDHVQVIHNHISKCVRQCGGKIKNYSYCPHTKYAGCFCRKPKTGMLDVIIEDYNVDVSNTFMVGDWVSDIQCGQRVGCKTILVKTGRGVQAVKKMEQLGTKPTSIKDNLLEAAKFIIKEG